VPTGAGAPSEGNKYIDKLKFGGDRVLAKETKNVIFKFYQKEGTDPRYKARSAFRIQVCCTTAGPEPTTGGAGSGEAIPATEEAAAAVKVENECALLQAMVTSFVGFMRQQICIPWARFGPAQTSVPFDHSRVIESTFSESLLPAEVDEIRLQETVACLGNRTTQTDFSSSVRFSFNFGAAEDNSTELVTGKAIYCEFESLGDYQGRYLNDLTLVRVLGILRPCPTETSSTLFQDSEAIFVAKQMPTSGEWQAFFVGGSSLVPIGEETSRGLTPSSELPLLAAANVTAIHKAIMNLLHKKSLGKDDVAFLSPISASLNQTVHQARAKLLLQSNADVVLLSPSSASSSQSAIAANLIHRDQPKLASCTSDSTIGGGVGCNQARSSGMSHYSQSAKKRNARLASDAPHFVFEDILQLQPTTTKYAKSNAEQLMRLEEGAPAPFATISPTSVAAPSWPDARSPVAVAPTARSSKSFAETSKAFKAKLEEVASLELAAKAHPEGSAVHTVLLEGAKKAKIEADQIINTVNI
jgi:hypothetical protein